MRIIAAQEGGNVITGSMNEDGFEQQTKTLTTVVMLLQNDKKKKNLPFDQFHFNFQLL